ncbi:cytosolic factor, phosphatidylinositol/phosphatidylcholine transfer protein [Rhodotorula sphaerocarpa]
MAPPEPEANLTHVPTRVAFSGHLGHLSSTQEKALNDFKAALEEHGYYTPAKGDDTPASVDDVTLVRFLRARKFDVQGAYAQFTASEDWRRSEHIDELYDQFSLPEFEMARQLYPQWTGRRDKSGLPVYVFEVASLTKEKTDPYSKDSSRLEPRIVALYEHMVQFVLPLCSAVPHEHQETPVSGCATLVDISGVSLQRFWALKNHMQRASTMANARYAETLGAGWIQKWFDEGTRNKIHILSASDLTSTLSEHMPPSSIPKKYGGTHDWTFGTSGPNLDRETRETLRMREGEELPKGPLRWNRQEGGLRVVGGEGRTEEERAKWNDRGKESGGERTAPAQEAKQKENPPEAKEVESEQEADAEPAAAPRSEVDSRPANATAPASIGPASVSERVATAQSTTTTTSTTTLLPEQPVHTTESTAVTTTSAPASSLPPPILRDAPSELAAEAHPVPVGGTTNLATNSTANKLATEPAVNGQSSPAEGDEREEEHDIHVAAREHPAAPIKDLAATLEGTAL